MEGAEGWYATVGVDNASGIAIVGVIKPEIESWTVQDVSGEGSCEGDGEEKG